MKFDYSQFFREEEDHNDELLEQQYQEFFEVIRIYLIIVLILTMLCFISNAIISKYRNRDLNSEVNSFYLFFMFYSIWIAPNRFPQLDKIDLPIM